MITLVVMLLAFVLRSSLPELTEIEDGLVSGSIDSAGLWMRVVRKTISPNASVGRIWEVDPSWGMEVKHDPTVHKLSRTIRDFVNRDRSKKFVKDPSFGIVLLNCDRLRIWHYGAWEALAVFKVESSALNWILHSNACGYDLSDLLFLFDDSWYGRFKASSTIWAMSGLPLSVLSCVLELHTLKGFTDDPDFDLVSAVHEFATSGTNINPRGFESWKGRVLKLEPQPKYRSFSSYVLSGDWQTSGSAGSAFNFYVSEDGVKTKVRATKNLVIDQHTPSYLESLCDGASGWVDKAIVKSEVTKSRLAVASDPNWYFVSAWLGNMFVDWMKSIPGVVGSESGSESRTRMMTMMSSMKGKWVLSFDYAKFDHQVSIEMLEVMVTLLVSRVRAYCLPAELVKLERLISVLRNHYLEYDDHGSLKRVRMSGGLPSGWWLTTMFANVFSYGIISGLDGAEKFWIKGDDSLIIFRDRESAESALLTLSSWGVDYSLAKSFLLFERGQFLRTFVDADGTFGAIVSRATAAAHQAKPWLEKDFFSDTPLSVSAVAVGVCFARANNMNSVFRFARRLALPAGAGVPTTYGGLGILPSLKYVRVKAEVKDHSVEPLPGTSFTWRSDLIAQSLSVQRDLTTDKLAVAQWSSSITDLQSETKHTAVAEQWVPDSIRWGKSIRMRPPPPLLIEYWALRTGDSKRKIVATRFPQYYRALQPYLKWSFKAADRWLSSGFELSLLIPTSSWFSDFWEFVSAVAPSPSENYFRSVFWSSERLLRDWLSLKPGLWYTLG